MHAHISHNRLSRPSPSPATHLGSPPGLQRLLRSRAHPLPPSPTPQRATPTSLPPPPRVLATGAGGSAGPPRPTRSGSPLPAPSAHAEPPALSRAQVKGIGTSTLLPLHPLGLPFPHGLQHPCALPCTTRSGSFPPPPPFGLRPPCSQHAPLSTPSTRSVPPHLPRVPFPLRAS